MAHYILGDLHFSHLNIIKYCDRPYQSIDEMNQGLINKWNEVVTDKDTVYVLGDVCMKKKELYHLDYMNGRKILVLGNHDIFEAKEYLKYFDDVRGYIVKDNIILSHIPVHRSELDRFTGNIHAHTHEKRVLFNNKIDPKYYCVSVEQIGYKPILLEEVIKILKELNGNKNN